MKRNFPVYLLLALLAFAGTASATVDNLPPNLPHNLHVFETSGPGVVNPGVLVGFNPQPDPPGDQAGVNLFDPYAPSFSQPGTGLYSILFGIHGPSGEHPSFTLGTGEPSTDGKYDFLAMVDGQNFQVNFDISGFTGGWSGFNPQPDPPGFGGDIVGFSFMGDPMLTVQIFVLDPNGTNLGPLQFTEVPEPGSLILLGTGLLGMAAVVRRKIRR